MTKPIHPRPKVITEGVKPKRIRRTRAQIAAAAFDEEIKRWATLVDTVRARLAIAAPEVLKRAERARARTIRHRAKSAQAAPATL